MSVERLIAACRSGEPRAQREAALALRDLGASDAAPELARLLESPDEVVRATAAGVLGELGEGGPALLRALDDDDALVRVEAAGALGLVGLGEAVPRLQRLLRADPDATVRASAAESLGDLRDPSALAALTRALRDQDDAVRGYAAAAIGLLGDTTMLDELAAALDPEPSPRVRGELLGARYRLGATGDLDPLLELLIDGDEDTASTLLNLVEELARMPPRADDAHRISLALRKVAVRHPTLGGHEGEIQAILGASA